MKILIVKSSSMGDIIHALPVAHDIREAMPDAEIHWVAEESFQDIPWLAPAVTKVHVQAFRRWRKSWLSSATRREVAAFRQALAAERYDVVLDIQGLLRSALVCRWTGRPSIGYTRRTVREPIASFFYSRHLDLPEEMGAVLRYRTAAAEALGYPLRGGDAVFGLDAKAEPVPAMATPYAAMAVNTSRDEKLWPEAHWVTLCRELLARGLPSVFYWGSAVEEERVRRIAAQVEGAVVAPRAPLAAVAAGLKGASLTVGVDTGLSHLAAALGCPSVGIFVSTPLETLRLFGDGPVESLGGVGKVPGADEVLAAAERVFARGRA